MGIFYKYYDFGVERSRSQITKWKHIEGETVAGVSCALCWVPASSFRKYSSHLSAFFHNFVCVYNCGVFFLNWRAQLHERADTFYAWVIFWQICLASYRGAVAVEQKQLIVNWIFQVTCGIHWMQCMHAAHNGTLITTITHIARIFDRK